MFRILKVFFQFSNTYLYPCYNEYLCSVSLLDCWLMEFALQRSRWVVFFLSYWSNSGAIIHFFVVMFIICSKNWYDTGSSILGRMLQRFWEIPLLQVTVHLRMKHLKSGNASIWWNRSKQYLETTPFTRLIMKQPEFPNRSRVYLLWPETRRCQLDQGNNVISDTRRNESAASTIPLFSTSGSPLQPIISISSQVLQ